MSGKNEHSSAGNLAAALFVNIAFTLIEVAGGLWTNSIAPHRCAA